MHREPCFLLRRVGVKGIRIRPGVNARCPHSKEECQDVAGVRFSAPTEEWSTALQEGLITYTPCKRDSGTGKAGILSVVFRTRGPQNGSMILYNRKKVKYRKDGYCWKKRKDGKTTREDHMKLKVQGVEVRCSAAPRSPDFNANTVLNQFPNSHSPSSVPPRHPFTRPLSPAAT
ncbi:Calmodulin-binding transcription activator 1 [Collichthys lucidus]|uniref:Calmodulin-binding transcription activator 1 n=1 Tax=Collichthys lucidus TaxID=240159 RepID=A0A4U5UQ72_COLLU|nr:Calmodulin-binding transcription activator 1 [Collichthys lucidus]